MKSSYKELLAVRRLRDSSREERSILDESESDKARVLYSASFRRLQRKTQVFPLEENAAIRSRMTHSLEVAHVGRYLSTQFLAMVNKGDCGLSREDLGIDENCALAIPNIVETACLLHDIGNPPFGHFGESAISNWFHDYWPDPKRKFFAKDKAAEGLASDFMEFDGNPQGFRIMTKIGGVDAFGMNLTLAQIASTVKYPTGPSGIGKSGALSKKAGVFNSEAPEWTEVWSQLELAQGARFPLAYLMEAADDISYCLSDIEDGIEKGFIRHSDFVDALSDGVQECEEAANVVQCAKKKAEEYKDSVDPVVLFRTKLITFLVKSIARNYCAKHQEIFGGEAVDLIENDSPEGVILREVRTVVRNLLYGRRSSHEMELTGHAAISGILGRYQSILSLGRSDAQKVTSGAPCGKRLEEEVKLVSLLPRKHLDHYRRVSSDRSTTDVQEWMARCHLVTDYVSGMTDVFCAEDLSDAGWHTPMKIDGSHPISFLYGVIDEYGPDLKFSFSRYFYRPRSAIDEREIFAVEAAGVDVYWLEREVKSLRPGWELALNSTVIDGRGRAFHIPMIDFVGDAVGFFLDSRCRDIVGRKVYDHMSAYDSGRSLHAYSSRLLTPKEWVRYMASLLLVDAPDDRMVIDHRWVGHRLMAGYAALRWSANSEHYLQYPHAFRVSTNS